MAERKFEVLIQKRANVIKQRLLIREMQENCLKTETVTGALVGSEGTLQGIDLALSGTP
jgi:hypothetical protein